MTVTVAVFVLVSGLRGDDSWSDGWGVAGPTVISTVIGFVLVSGRR